MMSDEEMAAAIERALEPFALKYNTNLEFDHIYDEVHLALMKLLDRIYDAGIKQGLHVASDEWGLR